MQTISSLPFVRCFALSTHILLAKVIVSFDFEIASFVTGRQITRAETVFAGSFATAKSRAGFHYEKVKTIIVLDFTLAKTVVMLQATKRLSAAIDYKFEEWPYFVSNPLISLPVDRIVTKFHYCFIAVDLFTTIRLRKS